MQASRLVAWLARQSLSWIAIVVLSVETLYRGSPRYRQLHLHVSCTVIEERSSSVGASLFQIQIAMFSLVGFSNPSTSFK